MKTTKLKALGACAEARAFARRKKSYQEGWEKNKRVDWALWLLCHASEESRLIAVGLAADFAERALHLVPEVDREVCRAAVEAARAYSRDPSDENLRRCWVTYAARAAVAAAAVAAAAAAAAAATYAAADYAYAGYAARAAYAAAAADSFDEERRWQMARVLEVCPKCPISEEGK